ncbi:asparagine synthase-related protein [Lentibacillus kimchii]|uniref:Asparagine synthase-related protein n=1 Tax=Lentibacillus kimchii TaxID=1542911 RepID=A0ABW2UPU4_9BACI
MDIRSCGSGPPAADIQKRYEEALQAMPKSQLQGLEQRRQEMQFLNLTHFLPMLMDRSNRLSVRAGLEVRTPFCDHRLVQYLW